MLITVVEAHVAEEHWEALQAAYTAGLQQLRPGILQTLLVHDLHDASHWQIMTIWASREAMMAARQSGERPPADRMFEAAGAQPSHEVFDVVAHREV